MPHVTPSNRVVRQTCSFLGVERREGCVWLVTIVCSRLDDYRVPLSNRCVGVPGLGVRSEWSVRKTGRSDETPVGPEVRGCLPRRVPLPTVHGRMDFRRVRTTHVSTSAIVP